MKKVRLVDSTMGAEHRDDYLYFNIDSISHYVHSTKRKALTDKVFPEIALIYFKGNSDPYRVRFDEFWEAIK